MSILGDLCTRGKFDFLWEYDQFMSKLNKLVAERCIKKVEPTVRSEWDLQADFFYDPGAQETYMLHHPEFPSRGEWVKVSEEYLENPLKAP